jgi:hypothetical protein
LNVRVGELNFLLYGENTNTLHIHTCTTVLCDGIIQKLSILMSLSQYAT